MHVFLSNGTWKLVFGLISVYGAVIMLLNCHHPEHHGGGGQALRPPDPPLGAGRAEAAARGAGPGRGAEGARVRGGQEPRARRRQVAQGKLWREIQTCMPAFVVLGDAGS